MKRGFALYYASVFAGVVLMLGVSMLNLILKEFKLSASLKESESAFFAADTGTECAMYWDLRVRYTNPGDYPRVFPTNNGEGAGHTDDIRCNGNNTVTFGNPRVIATPSAATTTFSFNVSGLYCVTVEVGKAISSSLSCESSQPDIITGACEQLTTIRALGNNVPCGVESSIKVERAIVTRY